MDFTEFTAEFKSAPVEDLMAKKLEMSNIVPQVAVTEKPKAPMQQIPIPARVPVLEGQIAEKLEYVYYFCIFPTCSVIFGLGRRL